jgi:hypothetical protein
MQVIYFNQPVAKVTGDSTLAAASEQGPWLHAQ